MGRNFSRQPALHSAGARDVPCRTWVRSDRMPQFQSGSLSKPRSVQLQVAQVLGWRPTPGNPWAPLPVQFRALACLTHSPRRKRAVGAKAKVIAKIKLRGHLQVHSEDGDRCRDWTGDLSEVSFQFNYEMANASLCGLILFFQASHCLLVWPQLWLRKNHSYLWLPETQVIWI